MMSPRSWRLAGRGASVFALVTSLVLFLAPSAQAASFAVNHGGLSPTVQAAAPELQVLGPSGLTVGNEAVFLADPLARRVIEYGRDLRPRRAWPFDLAPQDVLQTTNGQLCAIDAAAERLECRASASAPGPSVTRRLRAGAVALVSGPSGALWALRGDGFAGPAWGAEALVHALPMSRAPRWQAAGMWRGAERLEVLLWPWSARPDDKGVEPSRTLAFAPPPGLRAGSVRPLRMDAAGRLYVALEWLGGTRQLEVLQQVARVDAKGRRAVVQWLAASYAPGLQDFDVDAAGGVWRLYHTPGLVHLEVLPTSAWKEVAR